MSQWRDVLTMLENATGGWVTTHDIYDELRVKNPSQRIDDIERLTAHTVLRETFYIRGARAARYRLKNLRAENPAQAMGGALPDPEAGPNSGRNGGDAPGVHSDAPACALSAGERAPQLHFDLGLAA